MINNKNKINDKSNIKQNNYKHINLFYCNQMHPNFKLDEKILKNIIHRYISPIDNKNKIRFIIYYKKFKTLNLVVNKNSFPPSKIIEKTQCYLSIWENASSTIKKTLPLLYHDKIIKESHCTPFRF